MKSYWLNLPVSSVERTKTFFEAIGAEIHGRGEDVDGRSSVAVKFGSSILMYFQTSELEKMTGEKMNEGTAPHECIVSFDLSTNEEVDELAEKLEASEGKLLKGPYDFNGYYGLMFADPDGHLYNVIVM